MRFFLLSISIFISLLSYSQKGKTYFGFQFKPIVPNKFIGHFETEYDNQKTPSFTGIVKQELGYSFGMAIRHGISKTISFETGINFVQRNFHNEYNVFDSSFSTTSNVRLVNYQVPLNGLVYIQLAENWYMNASAGFNLNFFPSWVSSTANFNDINNSFYQITAPKRWFQVGVNANYGFEYRINKANVAYIGVTYNLPLKLIADYDIYWRSSASIQNATFEVDGSFLTLDLKYFIR